MWKPALAWCSMTSGRRATASQVLPAYRGAGRKQTCVRITVSDESTGNTSRPGRWPRLLRDAQVNTLGEAPTASCVWMCGAGSDALTRHCWRGCAMRCPLITTCGWSRARVDLDGDHRLDQTRQAAGRGAAVPMAQFMGGVRRRVAHRAGRLGTGDPAAPTAKALVAHLYARRYLADQARCAVSAVAMKALQHFDELVAGAFLSRRKPQFVALRRFRG